MGKKPHNAAKSEKKPSKHSFLWITLGLTFLLYLRALDSAILNFDDNEYFSNYPEILNLSFSNVVKYFSGYYVLMYQPIPVFTFAWMHEWFGLNPAAHHGFNLLFHGFNIYLVYIFTGFLSQKTSVQNTVTFLFALHPLAVEAVLWISCRSSVLYVFFYLLGLIAYLKQKQTGNHKYLWLCAIWFLLSLFSKAQAVTFPLALLCIDFFHFKDYRIRQLVFSKIHLFALSVIFGVVAISDPDTNENMAYTLSRYSTPDNMFLFFYELVWYPIKVVLPLNLAPIYVYPALNNGGLPWEYYLAPVLIGGLLFVVAKKHRQLPYLVFGLIFFYTVLSVTLQVIPSRLFIVADRYGYLPNLGLFYIIAMLNHDWQTGTLKFLPGFKDKSYVGYAVAGILVVLSFLQTGVWENDLSLSDRIIQTNPPTSYIGRAYGIRANYKNNILRQSEEALKDYRRAASLDSTDLISRYQMAGIYLSAGDTATAVMYYKQAQKADPESPVPLTDLGVLYSNRRQFNEALSLAEQALRISKNFPNAMVLKAVCLLNMGKAVEAEQVLTDCIRIHPQFTEAYKNRGIIRINNLNNQSGACTDFQKAADLGDRDAEAILNSYCR